MSTPSEDLARSASAPLETTLAPVSRALLLALMLAPAEGLAPTPPALAWDAPEGCPELTWVRARAEAYIGVSLDTPRPEPFSASAGIRGEPGKFSLALELRAGDGLTREDHEAASCDELAELVAIKIAMTLDPEAFAERYAAVEEHEHEHEQAQEKTQAETVEAPTAEADDTSETPEPAPPERVTRPPARSERGVFGFLGVGGGLGWGVVPNVGGAVSLAGGVGGRMWRLELRGVYWPTVSTTVDASKGVGATAFAAGGSARGCVTPRASIVEFPVCAGVEALALQASGTGVDIARTATRPMPSALVDVGVIVRWRRWGFFVRPELGVTLSQPVFRIRDIGVVPSARRVSARATAGVEIRFDGAGGRSERASTGGLASPTVHDAMSSRRDGAPGRP